MPPRDFVERLRAVLATQPRVRGAYLVEMFIGAEPPRPVVWLELDAVDPVAAEALFRAVAARLPRWIEAGAAVELRGAGNPAFDDLCRRSGLALYQPGGGRGPRLREQERSDGIVGKPERPRGLSKGLRPIFDLEVALGNRIERVDEPAGTACPLAVVFARPMHFAEIAARLRLPASVSRWENRDPQYPLEEGFSCRETRHALAGPLPEAAVAQAERAGSAEARRGRARPTVGGGATAQSAGMRDYEKAIDLMGQHEELQEFVGPRAERLVAAAEEALWLRFAPTYRRFLLEYGAGNFGSEEIYGVIDENFAEASIPDGVWFTLTSRKDSALPRDWVVVYAVGTGEYYCIDSGEVDAQTGEAPVVSFVPGRAPPGEPRTVVARDFGSLLLELVTDEIAAAEEA